MELLSVLRYYLSCKFISQGDEMTGLNRNMTVKIERLLEQFPVVVTLSQS